MGNFGDRKVMRATSCRRTSTLARRLSIAALAWLLAACGGGGDGRLPDVDGVTGLPADMAVLVSTNNGRELYFAAPGVARVEIHLDKPWGQRVASLTADRGRAVTGDWIRDGMRFYLQDVSNGRPLTLQYTLATAVATVDANGMRFYLQDRTSGDVTSTANTLAIATVDLQPSRQRYLSFYTTAGGVSTYSRDSMHRLGVVAPGALPADVAAIDMHASADGTLLYLLGSDFNYHVIDPANDAVKASFPVGSQTRSFGFMKGPRNEDLLIAAPDNLGNIAVVDPARQSLVAVLNCPCFGSVSGIMVHPATNVPFFVSVRPSSLPPVNSPVLGLSGVVLYSITQNLQLAEPYPLPVPPSWDGSTVSAGQSMLVMNAGPQGTLLVTSTQLRSFIVPNRPTDVVAYDIAGRTMTSLTQAFTLDAGLAVPGLASPDGASVYAQPQVLGGVGPDQRGTLLPGELSRFRATPGAIRPFDRESTFPMSNQPTLVTPPLALDDRYVFFGQVSIVGDSAGRWSSQPSSPFYLYRADRSTLQPVGFARIVIDDSPVNASVAPLVGLSTGRYEWPTAPVVTR